MIYDISPSEFINKMEYWYEDFFYAPPSRLFAFIDVQNRYADTYISIDTATGTVQYRNTRMKT